MKSPSNEIPDASVAARATRPGPTRKPNAVTVRDVAQRAMVAVGTVSRYLNGANLREHNRARIEKAIKELGYKENYIAKGMKTNRTSTIGVLFPALDAFHVSIVSSLEKTLSKHGYILVVCDFEDDSDVLERKLTFLLDRSVDGVIASPIPKNRSALEELRSAGVPTVFFNNSVPGFEADEVSSDGTEAVRRATDYLVAMNHRRIGFINGASKYSTAADRYEGYRQALERAGIGIDQSLTLEVPWNEPSGGYRAGMSMLSRPDRPTALISANYLIALGVLRAVRESGMVPQRDISLVNFDDSELFELTVPSITAIRQPVEDISRAAAELLIRRLGGDWTDFPTKIRLLTQLILRDSVRHLALESQ